MDTQVILSASAIAELDKSSGMSKIDLLDMTLTINRKILYESFVDKKKYFPSVHTTMCHC